eukprot:305157_1
MTSSSKWIILAVSTRSLQIETNQLLKTNDLEFAKYHHSTLKCIQKYNTINNKWTKWIQTDDLHIEGPYVAFALNQHMLYIYAKKKLIVTNTKQQTHINIYNCNNCAKYPATIIINNKLHFIGGLTGFSNKHLIWNAQQSQFDVKHEFEHIHIIFHRLIYLKSKN